MLRRALPLAAAGRRGGSSGYWGGVQAVRRTFYKRLDRFGDPSGRPSVCSLAALAAERAATSPTASQLLPASMPSDAVVEGVSGAIGGIVATVATYPLMTVNTLQAMRARPPSPVADEEKAGWQQGQRPPPPPLPHSRGTLHELAEIVRVGGWPALFSGLEASLIGTTISQGIYFYLYSLLRRLAVLRRAAGGMGTDLRAANITVAESLLVASLAGMGNVLLTNPIWMVATRMQALSRAKRAVPAQGQADEPQPSKSGMVAVARQVYGEYGLVGFWNGTAASLIMVINPTLQYTLYERLSAARARLRRGKGGRPVRPSALEVFLLSALAKMGATLVTYPMMNIKTRMYTASRSDAGAHHSSVLAAAAQIMRDEGLSGYYRGLRTKIVQSVLAASLLFVAKEKITDATRDMLGVGRAHKAVA